MNPSNALIVDNVIQKASQFMNCIFDWVQKPNFDNERKKIIRELSDLRLIANSLVVDNLIYHFDNLTLIVFNLKNFNIGPLETSWVKSIISKISASWDESKKNLSEDQLASYNKISDQNLEYAKELNALQASYFLEQSTKDIIDNLSSTKPNNSFYYAALSSVNNFYKIVTKKQQPEYLKLIKVLAALRLVDSSNFDQLKNLAFVIAKHLSIYLRPLSEEDQIRESSLNVDKLYEKERLLIDSLVTNYPISCLEIEELSQLASQISELSDKANFPKFFRIDHSFFYTLIKLKELHNPNSAASIMYECITNALDLFKIQSDKLSIEDVQSYINYLKDMTHVLKNFLAICPLDDDIDPNMVSNANQIVADFKQDFRDITSILSKIM